jgi:hypothetical protein
MTRSATATLSAQDHGITTSQVDAPARFSLARLVSRVAVALVLGTILSIFVAPLTAPWIVAAWLGVVTIVGTTVAANR